MRAMILAAGRGSRMGKLTDHVPKSLLRVGKYYLIEYAIYAVKKIGVQDIVINVSYRGEQIKQALGDGSRYQINIHYSEEIDPLETGGGIFQALPYLGKEPFIVLSSDVITDYPLVNLPKNPVGLAHLVLVNNPEYHAQGDFCLQENKIYSGNEDRLTFGNIGIYRPELFVQCKLEKFRLGNLLKEHIAKGVVTGEHYQGLWYNLGTPEDLDKLIAVPDIH